MFSKQSCDMRNYKHVTISNRRKLKTAYDD